MRQGTAWPILFLLLLVLASGCTGTQQNPDQPNPQNPQEQPAPSPGPQDGSLVGTWRNYADTKQTRMIEIKADHTWVFGPSNGTWRAEALQPGDWEAWGMSPAVEGSGYNVTQKMVLEGWSKGTWSGAILEGPKGVDFFYVVYNVKLPDGREKAIYIKFGRPNPLD